MTAGQRHLGLRARSRGLLVLVSVGLLASAAYAREGDPNRFAGTWEHVGGKSEQNGLLSAIEGSIADLNFLLRPLARNRLVKSSRIPSRVIIETEASQVTVKHGRGPALSSPLGSVIPVTSVDGDRIELSFRMRGGALVQRVASPDGARQTVYRLDPNGNRLFAEITTSSRYFSRALVYQLTFERVESEQVSRVPAGPSPSSQ